MWMFLVGVAWVVRAQSHFVRPFGHARSNQTVIFCFLDSSV